MHGLISGALAMGYAVAGLFFLAYWRQTRDRLFALFSVAFWILAAQRVALTIGPQVPDERTWLYVLRLAAFLVILAAIVDKNRAR